MTGLRLFEHEVESALPSLLRDIDEAGNHVLVVVLEVVPARVYSPHASGAFYSACANSSA